jgi:hypothetical protein
MQVCPRLIFVFLGMTDWVVRRSTAIHAPWPPFLGTRRIGTLWSTREKVPYPYRVSVRCRTLIFANVAVRRMSDDIAVAASMVAQYPLGHTHDRGKLGKDMICSLADRPGREPQLRGGRGETAGARGGLEEPEPREIRETHNEPEGVHGDSVSAMGRNGAKTTTPRRVKQSCRQVLMH